VEGNKVIIVPTSDGRKHLEGRGLEEDEDTVGGVKVKCFSKTFNSPIRNFIVTCTPSKNINSVFAFSSNSEQITIGFPHLVDAKEEATK
jgi:hypothetical protein